MQPTAIPKSSWTLAGVFFFFTGGVGIGLVFAFYGLAPLRHILGREVVGKIHERHIKRLALALCSRCYAAPQIGTKVAKTGGVYLGNLSARFLLETQHSPHSGATGVCRAVYIYFVAFHAPAVSGVSVHNLQPMKIQSKFQTDKRGY